jgi:hypothetical protein
MDGPVNSTTMLDHSPKQNGAAAVANAFVIGDGSSGPGPLHVAATQFNNNAYIYSPVNVDNSFNLALNDFTIDWWEHRIGDVTTYRPAFTWDTVGVTYSPMLVAYGTDAGLYYYASNDQASWNIISAMFMGTAQLNVWIHRAIVRKGSTFYAFENGVLKGTATSTLPFNNASYGPMVGCWPNPGGYVYFFGYMQEFRVSNGIARWTANFTPPTRKYEPYPDLNTRLLMHFDSSWQDFSQYKRGAASTFAGLTFSIAQSKFGRISALFDGLDDYASYPDSPDWSMGDDYTIDFWVRPTAIPPAGQAMAFLAHLAGDGWLFMILSDGGVTMLQRQASAGGDFSVYAPAYITINNWHHVAFVRANRVNKIYLNGVGGAPMTTPALPVIVTPLTIGMWGSTAYPFKGYMDELRITKGKALWTADFTPPTDVHGATGDKTVLMLHFDGDFKDSSQKRQVIHPGSAAISTAQKKFGNAAVQFNGAQICYVAGTPSELNFGYEDFTIDCWFYNTGAAGVNQALFGRCSPSLTDLTIGCYITAENRIVCSFGKTGTDWLAQMTDGIATVTKNAWHHYAVMRRNNVFSQYLDGVLDSNLQDYGAWPLYVSTWSFVIGAIGNNTNYWTGYIDEFRVTKGKALWTANFTPPAQPGN